MPQRSRQVQALAERLEETERFLDQHGEYHWTQWLRVTAQQLDESEARAGVQVLAAFYGAAPFDELVLSALAGHDVPPSEEVSVNDRLSELRAAIREEAERLARRSTFS